ncbi:hypothetical protein GWN91_00105 [Candidatus Saccharibacteria bacterium]|nr:hypothetical protein [Candidatus Saccharibacteria bacterium]NIV71195.1 hypothetical protein [Calditrichia bacterium]NIW77951.1 hypothetical protein [Calditrichia bacterium]
MNETNNKICKRHSGVEEAIQTLKADVASLWRKWDWIQKTFVGIFVGITLNLIAGIVILIIQLAPFLKAK